MSRISMVLASLMAIMTFIWHPTEAEAQVKDGLAGHWTFDKKDTDDKEAKDAIGKHHGVIMGKPQIVEGKAKEALSFDGKADYVVMGAVTEGQDLTYAMWVKVEKLPATPQVIIWDDDPQLGSA